MMVNEILRVFDVANNFIEEEDRKLFVEKLIVGVTIVVGAGAFLLTILIFIGLITSSAYHHEISKHKTHKRKHITTKDGYVREEEKEERIELLGEDDLENNNKNLNSSTNLI